jgi:uncharacterized radical SAM superfamily Fe-S cluster-containing enzyme
MAVSKETILTGAESICPDCKTVLNPKVLHSNAGFYIGTWCKCGPYSRESCYFKTRKEAEKLLPQYVAVVSQINN